MRKCERRKATTVPTAIALALTVIILWGAEGLSAQNAARQIPVPHPPMGWSSWNSFSNTVDSQIIMDQAKAMVSNGMAQAGYQ